MEKDLKTIRELCKLTGTSRRSLQNFHEIGLLSYTERGSNNSWLYDESAVRRLKEILFLQECGLTLKEIKPVLEQPDREKKKIFREKLAILKEKRARLDEQIKFVETMTQHGSYSYFTPMLDYVKPANLSKIISRMTSITEWEEVVLKRTERIIDETDPALLQERNDIFLKFDHFTGRPVFSQEVQALVSEYRNYLSKYYCKCSGIDLLILGHVLRSWFLTDDTARPVSKNCMDYISRVLIETGMKEIDDFVNSIEEGSFERKVDALSEAYGPLFEKIIEDYGIPDDASIQDGLDLIDVHDPRIQGLIMKADNALAKYTSLLDISGAWGFCRLFYENQKLLDMDLSEIFDDETLSICRFVNRAIAAYTANSRENSKKYLTS